MEENEYTNEKKYKMVVKYNIALVVVGLLLFVPMLILMTIKAPEINEYNKNENRVERVEEQAFEKNANVTADIKHE